MTSSTPRVHSRRPGRRTVVAAVCLAAVLGAAGASWALLASGPDAASASATDQATTGQHTSPVTHGDLTETWTYAGTLGYGAPVGIPGAAAGTVTWLPKPGQVVHRDEPLYAVDEQPVLAMHGTVPLWRTLESGDRGQDVAQLNHNLAALGYGVVEDDVFGRRTLAAVRQWQRDRHREVTGTIGVDDVVFVDGDVRIASVEGQLGLPAEGDVVRVTSTRRVVVVTVGQQDADRFAVDTAVDVRVNGTGDPFPGKVVDSAPVEDTEGGAPKVSATIALESGDRELPAAATAQVDTVGRTERDVLSVPVAAIVAAGQDEYAVDVVRGGTTDRVPVDVGFVADGRIAVTGDLREGDQVVVPS